MNALPLMAEAATMFRARLEAEPGCVVLSLPAGEPFAAQPSTALRWDNVLFRASTFRRAHVETFDVAGRLSVLHVCVFPHLDDPAPIFGFDMVAGPSRVTGIFLDLSPVTEHVPVPSLADVVDPSALTGFAVPRALPEWGDIFSSEMLAVRPTDLKEVSRAIFLAQEALDRLLKTRRFPGYPASAEIAVGQTRYIVAQRRNEHTLRMLTSFIGLAAARRFIDEVLFPLDQGTTSTTRPAALEYIPVP